MNNQGNFLNLVFTKCLSDNEINKIIKGTYISDHCMVEFTLYIQVLMRENQDEVYKMEKCWHGSIC